MEREEGNQPHSTREHREEVGSAGQFVTDFIQRQGLRVGDIGNYYDKWVVLASEIHGHVPQELHETIKKVGFGLGFLFYYQWGEMGKEGEWKQRAFQKRLQRHEINQLVLTYEQGQMLRDAAAVVDIAFDPGEPEDTPENIEKRTFVFADLEGMPPSTSNVIDADK